jgi:amino acid adenylation domain-containing protein
MLMSTAHHDSTRIQAVASRILPAPFKAWAGHTTQYPNAATISSLFEQVAAAQPDALALVRGVQRITYDELNGRANVLARILNEHGVERETLVAVCMERSVEALVAILAILKAGGAYVPLEPEFPAARTEALLAETKPRLLLLDETAAARHSGSAIPQLRLDDDSLQGHVSRQATVNRQSTSGARDLAYVMYTSGSTGQPKGVMVEQRSVIRLVRNTNYCEFGPQHVFLQAAPLSFDASTFEIWGALLNGSALVLLDSPRVSLDAIAQAVRDKRVTTLWLTSGLFNLMAEQRLHDLTGLQQLLAGGDILSARHVRKALEELPNCHVINGYGPTENTTFTCCHSMQRGDVVSDSVPLGRPISNTFVYILDSEGNPCEIGEPGELFTSGDGVARGYLNDSQLTAQHFLPNPFSNGSGRMYRTGDVARWNQNGEIEFLGRVDDQVKILGHRIEPLEIARALEAHPQIAQAHVLTDSSSDGGKRLVAYYTAPAELAPTQIRAHLQERIPEYMIPALLMRVENLPLSANGKIDRDALATIPQKSSVNASNTVNQTSAPPQKKRSTPNQNSAHDVRKVMQEMWRLVLHTEHVGLDDNFFDLGGDSLLLMSIHSRLQTQLSLKLPIIDLFEYTTIRKLAERIAELQANRSSDAERDGKNASGDEPRIPHQQTREQHLERQ